MFGLILIIFIIAVAISIYEDYEESTRLERQKQKFEDCLESIRKDSVTERDNLLIQSQRENLEELAVIVREKLNEFQMDIPPRLFQDAQASIDNYVDNTNCEFLYKLYKILVKTRRNLVFQELNRFFSWGYLK